MDDLNALAEYGSEVNSDDEEYRLVMEQALKESEEQKKREADEAAKKLADEEAAKKAAWVIGRAIKKRGLKARHILSGALPKLEADFVEELRKKGGSGARIFYAQALAMKPAVVPEP